MLRMLWVLGVFGVLGLRHRVLLPAGFAAAET
jgi:hypothetical protein